MKVLYSGSFNCFHIGHQYVYDVACKCFGKENVWLGVGSNSTKSNPQGQKEKIKFSLAPITNNVILYEGLTANVVKEHGFELLIRGIRAGRSLEQEEDLLYWNRKLGGVETILIPTPAEVNQISSSLIRELTHHKVDVSEYVDPDVYTRWNRQYNANHTVVYFGRSCSGKSTYIKDIGAVDMDKAIWKFLRLPVAEIVEIKENIKRAFYEKNKIKMKILIGKIGRNVDWEQVYSFRWIDAAVIGVYWKYIPVHLRASAMYVKVTTSDEQREKFIASRKVSQEFIDSADFFYKDPPYYDKEVIIKVP